jgi:hypothetical protein
VSLLSRLPIDHHGAALDQPLRRGARPHVRQPADELIQPLSGGVRGDDVLQRFTSAT